MVRIATLLAAVALIAASPAIDDHDRRFALGVLRRDGLLLPFASYDGSWSVAWPYGLVNIPISISGVPKKWWGAVGPEARWTAWLPENSQRPLALQKLRATSVFCDIRLGIQTDYMGSPFNPREPTAPKDGVAIAGDAALLPITTVSANSPDAKALARTITDHFNDEERVARRGFTRWKHPYDDAQRRTFPLQIAATPTARAGGCASRSKPCIARLRKRSAANGTRRSWKRCGRSGLARTTAGAV